MIDRSRLPRSTPEAQGVPSAAILGFIDALDSDVRHVHSLMMVRHGHVIAEGWWQPYAADRPHMLFSVSKSFTSTAVGIAVGEGLLSVDDTVASLLPDDVPGSIGERLARTTVRHLLTMSRGHDLDSMAAVGSTPGASWARDILALPIEHEPGTRFQYDTGETYLLSAIIQRLTGQRLLDYLGPRLFRPLGIAGATWETDPQGIDVGGYGLSMTTEDVAAFGQLYLQRGAWEGRQLIPTDWVDTATTRQIGNGDPAIEKDWTQGYGYQFWRSRHDSYRGDGAFGQLCVVLPDRDVVVAITAGLPDMQIEMDRIWEHLLPALDSTVPLSDDPAAHGALVEGLRDLALPFPEGAANSPAAARVSGNRYRLASKVAGLMDVGVTFEDGRAILTVTDRAGDRRIVCGQQDWVSGWTRLHDGSHGPVAAAFAWPAEDRITAQLWYTATPFAHTIDITFRGDDIELRLRENVAFGPPADIRVTGTAAR